MGKRERRHLASVKGRIPDPGHRKRHIADDTRGPTPNALGAEITLPASTFGQNLQRNCAQWTDPEGKTREVTVVGSSPVSAAGAFILLNDLVEIGVFLRYRSGGVTRVDQWVWNPQGWRRTLMASQVDVIAVRIPTNSNTGLVDITVGAGIADTAGVQDGTVLTIRDGIPEGGQGGVAQSVGVFPVGTHEIRLWQNPSLGSFELGFSQELGFTTYLSGLGLSELEDWHSIGTANAIRFAPSGTDTGSLAWLYCRG